MGCTSSRSNAIQPVNAQHNNHHELTVFPISPKPPNKHNELTDSFHPIDTTALVEWDTEQLLLDDNDTHQSSLTNYEHKRHHTLSPTDQGQLVKLHQYKNKVSCVIITINIYNTIEYNTIHYIALIHRCIQLYMPCIQHFKPLHSHTHLNKFYILYDTCIDSLHCAFHLFHLIELYNKSINGNTVNQLYITGIAIDYGDIVLELPSNKLFGVASDCALQLSDKQYMIYNNTIQCSSRVKRQIQSDDIDLYESIQFSRCEPDSSQHAHQLHNTLQAHYYSIQPITQYKYQYSTIANCNDDTYIHNNLLQLTKRFETHLAHSDIQLIDKQLIECYHTANDTFILRYVLDTTHVTQHSGALIAYEINNNIRTTYHSIIELHTGLSVDDTYAIFGSAVDAILCCIAMIRALQHYNTTALDNDVVESVGFAVDCSHLLVIPETDVCHGSAVYIADEMLQFTNGGILISGTVYKNVYDALKTQCCFAVVQQSIVDTLLYKVTPNVHIVENGVVSNIKPMC